MIENVGFVSHERFVLEGGLHRLDAPLVLLEVEVGYSLLVEHLRVFFIYA